MLTSRSEYRLLLRQDNADIRLTGKGYKAGLISKERYNAFKRKEEAIEKGIKKAKNMANSLDDSAKKALSSFGIPAGALEQAFIFLKYEGLNGLPGSSKTVIELIDQE